MAVARVCILIWFLVAGSGAAQPDADAPHPEPFYAGRALKEALFTLTGQGVELVFTDRVVRPDMWVENEPTAGDARGILDQLLSPHGLTTLEGTGGALVIVSAELGVASVTGSVRHWRSGRRLRGVTVKIVESGRQTVTAVDGRFRITEVAAGSYFLQASRPGFMVLQTEIEVPGGEGVDVVVELRPIALTVEQIDVHAAPPGLLGEEVSTLRFERQDLRRLPRLGEDLLRPMTLLPGTAGNDLSARFHIRGGRSDEVMVRLDGFEILEPYHLMDFDGALSIVAPAVVGEAELITGAFPVQYGDRMSGVLDLTTREPPWERRSELGVSVLLAEASRSGTLGNEKGHWLAALRAGSLEPAAHVAAKEENPGFSDAFGKVELAPAPDRSLRGNLLVSEDRLDFVEDLGEIESAEHGTSEEPDAGDDLVGRVRFRTSYLNGYAWASHQAVLGSGLYLESKASISRVDRDRQGDELDAGGTFELSDERRLTTFAAGQDWTAQISSRHELKWGFELRDLDADFDYLNERELTGPLAAIGHRPPEDTVDFDQRFRGQQYAGYLADRFRPRPAVTLDWGLRYDQNTVLGDSDFSPRLSLAYRPRPKSRLRLAWGLFHQSQRLYELQVADGETRFFPAERSEQRIAGFEHAFGRDEAQARRPLTLRVELYEHRISGPRPRFENLYDPISLAPEVEADRVRIAPRSSRARGLEIFFAGGSRRFDWFASYARARSEDRIDGRGAPEGRQADPPEGGQADVPRGIDQPDALKLGLAFSPRQWRLHLALEIHTGWPTTGLTAREGGDDEPEIVPVLGPLYGERLPTYRRLDLRASRRFALRRGDLELYLDVQNVSNAANVRGFDVTFETPSDGQIDVDEDRLPRSGVTMNRKLWVGLAPSFGIRWSF